MTIEEGMKYLNAVNTQLTALAKRYGTKSAAYKRLTEVFEATDDYGNRIFEGIATKRKDGSWRIKRSPSVIGTRAFNILQKKDYRIKSVEKGLTGTKQEKIEKMKANARTKKRYDKFIQALYTGRTESERKELAPEIYKKGKKSFEDMNKLMKKYNKDVKGQESEKPKAKGSTPIKTKSPIKRKRR